MLYKGKEVNNDDVGKGLFAIMDEIYIEAKLHNDNVTKFDVQAIIGLWEAFKDPEEDGLT